MIKFNLLFFTLLLAACAPSVLQPCSPTIVPAEPSAIVSATPTLIGVPVPMLTVAPSAVTQVNENENGKTLNVKPGVRVRVVLNSTYWTYQGSSDSQTLRSIGEPTVAPDLSVRIPGTGAGTVTLEFQALKAGTAKISASRVSCGEALLCPEDKRSFQVTVVIAP